MGATCSCVGEAWLRHERDKSKQIEKELKVLTTAENRFIKLLLLGTGESGKSTVFKQMQILYNQGFNGYERQTFRHVIRRNVVESMQVLLDAASKFGFQFDTESAVYSADFVMKLEPLSPDFWVPEIAAHIHTLWDNEPAVRQAYAKRAKLQLPDSAEYFLNLIDQISDPDYTPSVKDILHARLRTSGIVEREFDVGDVKFKFLDVGGQRNERRKWIHCFDQVTAVIFVTAISEYNQVLYEDEKKNRLHESLDVFAMICNASAFRSTAMILFLNKTDLFHDKILSNDPDCDLKVCFDKYPGPSRPEDPVSVESDAKEYIKLNFLARRAPDNQKDVYCHFTCATDTDQIEKVFNDCKNVILKKNLDKLGLT